MFVEKTANYSSCMPPSKNTEKVSGVTPLDFLYILQNTKYANNL